MTERHTAETKDTAVTETTENTEAEEIIMTAATMQVGIEKGTLKKNDQGIGTQRNSLASMISLPKEES